MPRRDPVLKLLLIWVTLLTAVVWTTLIFGLFAGTFYVWEIGPWHGQGMRGDYWKLAVVLVFVMVLQVSGRRGPRPIFPFLLVPFLIAADAAVIWLAWFDQTGFNPIEGPLIGGALVYILPTIFTLFVFIGLWWTMRRWNAGRFLHADPPWGRRNWILLGIASAIIPVQAVLYAYMDSIDPRVLEYLAIIQWFVLNAGLTAPSARPEPPATPEPFPPP